MNKFIIVSILLQTFFFANAQDTGLFMPREIKNAVKNKTRTMNGMPGPEYWQNSADYKITASLNPETGKISGKQTVTYLNNSPHTLNEIVFNLYPNLFKKGATRDREVDPKDLHDGVKITEININGTTARNFFHEGTRLIVRLSNGLQTNSKILIEMQWEFAMHSFTKIRVGKHGKNTWFIGYWYPQVSVYDDLFGWDEVDYDGLHEFYSAYANFDVKITMPANQIVWATGIWQNPSEILNDTFLKKYNQALQSEKVTKIVAAEDLGKKITKSNTENTWHYIATNVTDFCFATSDQYLWDGVSVYSDKDKKNKAFVQAAYKKTSRDFYEVADISKKSIEYLSMVMPAIPFPYPRMTVFNGDGGMEFPMMVNDRSEMFRSGTVNLTSHEIAHTYFPFYVGINQERYSWMDEGWAQFLPTGFQEQEVPGNKQSTYSAMNYSFYAGTSNEMPMMVPAYFLKGYEYYITSYYRPEIAFRVLQNLLGGDLFLKALQEFVYRWNGKYPNPYDMFYTFSNVAGEDLNWFWKPWFFDMAYPDLAIQSVVKLKDYYSITIENIGGLPLPIELTIEYTDGTRNAISKTAEVWKTGVKQIILTEHSEKIISKCTIGADWIPDTNKSDNSL
jgi:hypothetical protein